MADPGCGQWTCSALAQVPGGYIFSWGCCPALVLGLACLSLAKHPARSPPWLWETGSGLQLLQTLSRVVCPKGCSLVFCTADLRHGLKPVYGSAAFSWIVPQLRCSLFSNHIPFFYFLQSIVLVYLTHRGKCAGFFFPL